jgi:hypothetical protein
MAPWSPTTSAASTPARRGSPTCAKIASRTAWRACSTGCAQVAAQAPRRRIARAGAHVAGGLDALLPQPQLVVEARAGLTWPVRRLQAHGPCQRSPGRSSPGSRCSDGVPSPPLSSPAVPAQHDARRHGDGAASELRRFRREAKAQAGLVAKRQGRDDAGELQVHAFSAGSSRVARNAAARQPQAPAESTVPAAGSPHRGEAGAARAAEKQGGGHAAT